MGRTRRDVQLTPLEKRSQPAPHRRNAHAIALRDLAAEIHHLAHRLHNMGDEGSVSDDDETAHRIRARLARRSREPRAETPQQKAAAQTPRPRK